MFLRDKKTFKNIDYWISYSYLDTKRDFQNYPAELEPNFAAKHTASSVVIKDLLQNGKPALMQHTVLQQAALIMISYIIILTINTALQTKAYNKL